MLSELKSDYQKFKERILAVQLLRASNMTFVVFAYWNLLRTSVSANTSLSALTACAVLGAVTGIVLMLIIMLKFTDRIQVIILPVAMVGFLLTENNQPFQRLVLIPIFALIYLLSVKLIIRTANWINRF